MRKAKLAPTGVSPMKRHFLKLALAATAAAALAACGGSDDPPPLPNVVKIAQSDPQFSILVEAIIAAKLDGTLSGTGPFTVFAPTNDAFAKLLAELQITKAALLADTVLLPKVLTYHVVRGKVFKSQVPIGAAITTLQSETFTVDASLTITDQRSRKSKITATDLVASNGVVHVIDTVILPKP
jgi:uncharacterized surface protein with fasciclin (FAS1) repeats